MPFKNTKWDYIILTGTMIVFLWSFFSIEYIPVISDYNETLGYGMKIGLQVILAPLIALHRIFLLICGEYQYPRLRELNLRLRFKLKYIEFIQYCRDEWARTPTESRPVAIVLWIICFIMIVFVLSLIFT
jgi:hypothetical protein